MKPGEILFLTRDDVIVLGGRDMAFATNVIEAMFAAWAQGEITWCDAGERVAGRATCYGRDSTV